MELSTENLSFLEKIYVSLLQHFECALQHRWWGLKIEFFWTETIKGIDIVIYRLFDPIYDDFSSNLFYIDHNATLNKLQQTVDTFFDNNNKTLTVQEQTQFETWLFEQCFYYKDDVSDYCECGIEDFKDCEFIVFYEE